MCAFYKLMRGSKSNPHVDPATFIAHLQELYNPTQDEEFPEVQGCERDPTILTSPISKEEIETVMKTLNSKAIANMGISPRTLKDSAANSPLSIILTSIFNHMLDTGTFPELWMKSACIFLFKKGCKSDPNNYRTICIQNAFMKLFGKIMSARITKYQEFHKIVPDCQFGFRPNLSTAGAVTILHEVVTEALSKKQKVFAVFVDLKKAFDTVHRQLLYNKMLQAGYPRQIANLIKKQHGSLSMTVRAEGINYGDVKSAIGVPQGQPESPGLFNLFTADLPAIFEGQGAVLAGKKVPLIMYADDMVLLSNCPFEVQEMLNRLCNYLAENNLQMNTDKTKLMIFHKGRLPNIAKRPFHANNVELEQVKEFVYLGVTMTPQLSYTKHLENINMRARTKIGIIFAMAPLQMFSLSWQINCTKLHSTSL